MGVVRDILGLVDAAGLRVVSLPMRVAERYIPAVGVIALDSRLTWVEARCTLAHEYCHYVAGHECSQDAHVEARVDEQAARLLVSVAEYALAEHLVGNDTHLLGEELGLTVRYVEAFRRSLARQASN